MYAVCLAFTFQQKFPYFQSGCFSNGEIGFYVKATPGLMYSFNNTVWMIRSSNDPYVLSYMLSDIYDVPLTIYGATVYTQLAETFFFMSCLIAMDCRTLALGIEDPYRKRFGLHFEPPDSEENGSDGKR